MPHQDALLVSRWHARQASYEPHLLALIVVFKMKFLVFKVTLMYETMS